MKNAWVVRPYPHGTYRMKEFLEQKVVAIGWPALGDLKGLSRDEIWQLLEKEYYPQGSPQKLGQVTGIIDRFVNQIEIGDGVVVPDGGEIYVAEVDSEYRFEEKYAGDIGYAHLRSVKWLFGGRPVKRSELPATLYDSLKGRQTVFGMPSEFLEPVIELPDRYLAFDSDYRDESYKATYIEQLASGAVPGINPPAFEEVAMKVLSLYFPTLRRLSTRNAPAGSDTDLISELPGNVTVRIQVKCFQDKRGDLERWVVDQLRGSMEAGDKGLIVTTSRVTNRESILAPQDELKPIEVIDGPEFAQLVFENLDKLNDKDLWALGLRRKVAGR